MLIIGVTMTETTREQRDLVRAALDNREYVEFNESHMLAIEGALDDLARAEELLREAWGVIAYFDQDDPRVRQIRAYLSGVDDND